MPVPSEHKQCCKIIKCLARKDFDKLDYLISLGYDINAQRQVDISVIPKSPVEWAVDGYYLDKDRKETYLYILKALILKYGANPNIGNYLKTNIISMVVRNDDIDIFKYLVGKNYLDPSTYYDPLLGLLLHNVIISDIKSFLSGRKDDFSKISKYLIQNYKKSLDLPDEQGETPLTFLDFKLSLLDDVIEFPKPLQFIYSEFYEAGIKDALIDKLLIYDCPNIIDFYKRKYNLGSDDLCKFRTGEKDIISNELLNFIKTENLNARPVYFEKICTYLKNCGIGPNTTIDSSGDTILHFACKNRNVNFGKYLLSKTEADLYKENKNGDNAIVLAAKNNHLNLILDLINCNPNIDFAEQAIKNNQLVNLEALLKACRAIEDTDEHQKTLENYLILAYESNNLESIKFLLSWGANSNAKNLAGKCIFDLAMRDNNLETIKLLLPWGANPNAKNSAGECIFDIAIRDNNLQVFWQLINKEDLNITRSNYSADHIKSFINNIEEPGTPQHTIAEYKTKTLSRACDSGYVKLAKKLFSESPNFSSELKSKIEEQERLDVINFLVEKFDTNVFVNIPGNPQLTAWEKSIETPENINIAKFFMHFQTTSIGLSSKFYNYIIYKKEKIKIGALKLHELQTNQELYKTLVYGLDKLSYQFHYLGNISSDRVFLKCVDLAETIIQCSSEDLKNLVTFKSIVSGKAPVVISGKQDNVSRDNSGNDNEISAAALNYSQANGELVEVQNHYEAGSPSKLDKMAAAGKDIWSHILGFTYSKNFEKFFTLFIEKDIYDIDDFNLAASSAQASAEPDADLNAIGAANSTEDMENIKVSLI